MTAELSSRGNLLLVIKAINNLADSDPVHQMLLC